MTIKVEQAELMRRVQRCREKGWLSYTLSVEEMDALLAAEQSARHQAYEEAAKVADAKATEARERYEKEPPGPAAIAFSATRNAATDIAARIRALTQAPASASPTPRGAGE